jgi:exopolysaccharide production protein ExoQ
MRAWDVEELWSIVLLILFAMGGYVPFAMKGLADPSAHSQFNTSASNPISQAMIIAMWLGTLVPVGRILPQLLSKSYAIRPLMPYILLALASTLWSQDPVVSLRKLLSFVLTCIFAFYFAVRFPLHRQLKMVYTASSLIAISSVAMCLVAPKFSVDHSTHVGAWQGILAGKNALAMIMVIGLAAALVQQPKSTLQQGARAFMMLLFAGVMFMAGSSGALVVIAVLWASLPLLNHLARYQQRTRALISVMLFIGGAGLVIGLVEYLPLILKLLNRDPTLTGRTDIWKAVLISIFKHPLLGYGYGAFWLGLRGESANVVLAVKWAVPHAHNGFLDIWLALGGVGLACFGYALLKACRRIWQILLSDDLKASMWMISIVILVVTFNLDESNLISAPSVMWILLVSAFCGLELYAHQHPRRVVRPNYAREVQIAETPTPLPAPA